MSAHPMRALHVALYQALTGHTPLMALIQGVYDYVPHEASFPCLVIEDSKTEHWALIGAPAYRCEVKLAVYSRRSAKEVMEIAAVLHTLLHKASFVVAGFEVALAELVAVDAEFASDGMTAVAGFVFHCQMVEVV